MKLINITRVGHLQLFPLIFFLFLLLSCNGQNGAKDSVGDLSQNNLSAFEEKTKITLPPATTRIFHASNGDYWFATKNNGAYLYEINENTGEGQLTNFHDKSILASNRIRGIQEGQNGNIYIDAIDRFLKYDGEILTKLTRSYDTSNDWKLSKNDVWFEGDFNKNGILCFDGKEVKQLKFGRHFLENEYFDLHSNNASLSIYDIYTSCKDSQGNLWIGTSTFGACRFDGKNIRWISEIEMTEVEPGPAPGVRSILEDRNGHFWFSSNLKFKYKITGNEDPNNKESLQFEKIPAIDIEKEDLSIACMALTEDNEGDIWLANYTDGVHRFDGKKVTHYPINIDNKDAEVFSIYKDNNGKIWVGTFNLGPLYFNGTSFVKFQP